MGSDRRDTPPGPHQAVSKNGKDHVQDREIKNLAEQNQRHHDEFIAFTKQDLGSHSALDKTIQGVKEVADGTKQALDKYTFTGKVLWGLFGMAWTLAVAGVGWMVSEVDQMDQDVRDVAADLSRTEATDAALRSALDDMKQDLRDLRRLVQEHQINKREHNSQKEHD